MNIDNLEILITISGLFFFTISLLLIFLGKKVGNPNGRQNIKVGNWVDIGTNSVLTLVLITAAITLTPLILRFLKPEMEEYSVVLVHGYVLDETGLPAKDAEIEVVRNFDNVIHSIKRNTGGQGSFMFEIEHAKPKETYELICRKNGYADSRLSFGFNEIPFPIVLKRKSIEDP